MVLFLEAEIVCVLDSLL
jgi:hypothetical protein